MEFVPPGKRIAYAASFGVPEIPDDMKHKYSKYLKQIPHISCREDRGCEITEELTGKRPEHVIYLDKFYRVNSCFALPQEFLFLVDHTQIILTDSFHGCAFSVIFNRPFCYFERELKLGAAQDMSSRFSSLFRQLNCKSEENDYTEANKAVMFEREKGFAFLNAAPAG